MVLLHVPNRVNDSICYLLFAICYLSVYYICDRLGGFLRLSLKQIGMYSAFAQCLICISMY